MSIGEYDEMSRYCLNCTGMFSGAGIIAFTRESNHFILAQSGKNTMGPNSPALSNNTTNFKPDLQSSQNYWRLSNAAAWWATMPFIFSN